MGVTIHAYLSLACSTDRCVSVSLLYKNLCAPSLRIAPGAAQRLPRACDTEPHDAEEHLVVSWRGFRLACVTYQYTCLLMVSLFHRPHCDCTPALQRMFVCLCFVLVRKLPCSKVKSAAVQPGFVWYCTRPVNVFFLYESCPAAQLKELPCSKSSFGIALRPVATTTAKAAAAVSNSKNNSTSSNNGNSNSTNNSSRSSRSNRNAIPDKGAAYCLVPKCLVYSR